VTHNINGESGCHSPTLPFPTLGAILSKPNFVANRRPIFPLVRHAFNETVAPGLRVRRRVALLQFRHINQEAECVLPDSEAATFYGELNADIAGANLVIQPEAADKAEESSFIPLFRHNVVDYHPVNGRLFHNDSAPHH
jgi:hypothetical protein